MLKRGLLTYWFICSVGLIGILYGVSRQLRSMFFLNVQSLNYNEWALHWVSPGKPQELVFEVGVWIGLFIYYFLVWLVLNTKWLFEKVGLEEKYLTLRVTTVCGILLIASNGLIFGWFRAKNNSVISITSLVLVLLWIIKAFILPFCISALVQRLPRFPNLEKVNAWAHSRGMTAIVVSMLTLMCLHFVLIFVPFIRGELKVINEYFDIPEYTYLGGQFVSNTEYINSHRLAGLNKYDPIHDSGRTPTPRAGTYAPLPKSNLLESFVKDHATDYYYNDDLQALVVNRGMTGDEYMSLASIYREDGYRKQLTALHRASSIEHRWLMERIATSEEVEFFEKNQLEIHNQILNRWVIHHHNFVLGPINEYIKGKPLKDISAQYGSLNVIIMATLLKWAGGVSYGNYFPIWYSFWLIYFALFVGCSLLIFRNVFYVALVCVLAFGYIMMIDYLMLHLGPGLNPIRHFFDIPVLAGFCLFLRKGTIGLLVLAIMFALLGVVNNVQFGLALAVALGATIIIMALVERNVVSSRRGALFGLLGALLIVAPVLLILLPGLGKNSMLAYYLGGFLGPPFSIDRLVLTMLAVSAGYVFLLYFEKAVTDMKYIALFLLLYSQGLFFYYTWGNTPPHILNLAPLLVLCVVGFLKLILDGGKWRKYQKLTVSVLIVITFCSVYLPGSFAYYSTKETFDRNFIDHKTYQWTFGRTNFTSTMDPQPFLDSISLIQEFSDADPAVYILSKYDNFIPFLADKYSAMPFFDVPWFLITTNETNLCIEHLRTEKPAYIFVDTDIERNLNGDIITAEFPKEGNYNKGLGVESQQRVVRLNLLKQIFSTIKKDYEPVKVGILLTAYKRKT